MADGTRREIGALVLPLVCSEIVMTRHFKHTFKTASSGQVQIRSRRNILYLCQPPDGKAVVAVTGCRKCTGVAGTGGYWFGYVGIVSGHRTFEPIKSHGNFPRHPMLVSATVTAKCVLENVEVVCPHEIPSKTQKHTTRRESLGKLRIVAPILKVY